MGLLIFDVFLNLFIKCKSLKDFEEKPFKEEFARPGEVKDTVERNKEIDGYRASELEFMS